jgi:hypothetical protein
VYRRTVAILDKQYLRLKPFKQLVEALQIAGRNVLLPRIVPMPQFIRCASQDVHAY